MVQPSWLRTEGDRARRLARDSTDAMLQTQLETRAAEYFAEADRIENGKSGVLGLDPERP